ncbi:hypothetical protein DRO34_04615 [Candidatus Bathyarchaeota archaeon]|nr:MAG: hypothetical protein DRO34_04615 [Candidatus Bathyarchaeota archaeon]
MHHQGIKKHNKTQNIPKHRYNLNKQNQQKTTENKMQKQQKIENNLKQQIVQRIFRNFTDIMILRLLKTEPMWGYKIKKRVQTKYGIKLRHGALYPLLNKLEKQRYIKSTKQQKGGRIRKVYHITQKGILTLNLYQQTIKEQLQ